MGESVRVNYEREREGEILLSDSQLSDIQYLYQQLQIGWLQNVHLSTSVTSTGHSQSISGTTLSPRRLKNEPYSHREIKYIALTSLVSSPALEQLICSAGELLQHVSGHTGLFRLYPSSSLPSPPRLVSSLDEIIH